MANEPKPQTNVSASQRPNKWDKTRESPRKPKSYIRESHTMANELTKALLTTKLKSLAKLGSNSHGGSPKSNFFIVFHSRRESIHILTLPSCCRLGAEQGLPWNRLLRPEALPSFPTLPREEPKDPSFPWDRTWVSFTRRLLLYMSSKSCHSHSSVQWM